MNGVQYFAQNSTKTCVFQCLSPNYGDLGLHLCVPKCNTTFYGENTTRLCISVSSCGSYSAYAEKQNNLCVSRCSNTPIQHYAEDSTFTCVLAINCPIVNTFQTYAQNSSQKCVPSCGTN